MAQKYIEGDVVMYGNKVMVVKEPRDGSHFDLSCPKVGLVYCLVDIDEIKPVSLTPEILEKNGWEPTKESLGHSFKNKKYPRFALWSINDKWNFTIDGVMVCNTLSCLCYVHELQHLLFGLNINHEMEV